MKAKMTFTDLVDKIASETGATKKLVHDLLIETVALNNESLEKEGHTNFPGLGRFSLKWHKARKGHNPQSGKTIDIPAHSTVNFNAQTSLRDHINRHYANLHPEFIETLKTDDIKKETQVIPAKEEKVAPAIIEASFKEKKQEENIRVQPSSKKPPSPPKVTKERIASWWLILLILIIILIWFLWPSSQNIDADKTPTEKTLVSPAADEKDAAVENPAGEQQKTMEKTTPVEKQTPPAAKETKETSKVIESNGITSTKHKIQSGDYLYKIAENYYKKAHFWPLIYKANREYISNPDLLVLGRELKLPALQGIASNLSEQDKKDIAEGYMEVYLFYKDIDKNKALYHLWVVTKLNQDVLKSYTNRINSGDMESINNFKGELEI